MLRFYQGEIWRCVRDLPKKVEIAQSGGMRFHGMVSALQTDERSLLYEALLGENQPFLSAPYKTDEKAERKTLRFPMKEEYKIRPKEPIRPYLSLPVRTGLSHSGYRRWKLCRQVPEAEEHWIKAGFLAAE